MFKNTRQVEFSELVETMRVKGVKPAGVARLLKISKASVSKILDGLQTPRENTLELLRHIVAQHSRPSGNVVYRENAEAMVLRDEYAIKLRNLPEKEQRTVETIIDSFAANSKVASAARASGVSALRAARESGPKSSPSPQAGAPSAHKRAPKRGTGSHSKDRPAPPGPAPEQ